MGGNGGHCGGMQFFRTRVGSTQTQSRDMPWNSFYRLIIRFAPHALLPPTRQVVQLQRDVKIRLCLLQPPQAPNC